MAYPRKVPLAPLFDSRIGGNIDMAIRGVTDTIQEVLGLSDDQIKRMLDNSFRPVIIETPYAGKSRWWIIRWLQRRKNVRYARACMVDALNRGEAPMLSHLLYTQVLDDNNPEHRMIGIKAGLAWGIAAKATIVYNDRGTSRGMAYGIQQALAAGRQVIYRSLNNAEA